MTVQFMDLYAQHAPLEDDFVAAFRSLLSTGDFSLGRSTASFEKAFAAYCGTSHCCGVSSGLDALVLALEACGIGPGDEVILPANTFIATALAVSRCGATPVLVDCDAQTRNIDPDRAAAAVTPATRVVIPVHLYGRPAPMDDILSLARAHNLVVIEDAAQAHGALYRGRKCGSLGVMGCFSFYPGKNLGALCQAGAVTTDDPELNLKIEKLRNVGSVERYAHEMKGGNYRMDGLQAAFLEIKLRHLDEWNVARQRIAGLYLDGIDGDKYGLPSNSPGDSQVYHLFVIRCADRDAVSAALKEADVQFGVHYPIPIHLQPAYRELGKGPGSYPVTEELAGQILSLPMHPSLDEEAAAKVVEVLNDQKIAGLTPKEMAVSPPSC